MYDKAEMDKRRIFKLNNPALSQKNLQALAPRHCRWIKPAGFLLFCLNYSMDFSSQWG